GLDASRVKIIAPSARSRPRAVRCSCYNGPRMLQDLDLRRQAIAAAVFVALTIALVVAVRQETGAAYTYPLDDTYIHTALARNLIESHTWGINPGEFANASTS